MTSLTEIPTPAYAERVNIIGQRLLSLERPAYKVGPWLASGTLDFWRVLTIP